MKASRSTAANAEDQVAAFIRKFDPPDQRLIRAVRRTLRKRFPTANELVWDNYNFFVIGYSPTERPSDAIGQARVPLSAAGRGETDYSLRVCEAAAAEETATPMTR